MMVPLYKSEELVRDGFSLMIDQIRMDFDLDYLGNISKNTISNTLLNKSLFFEYEMGTSKKMKRNLHLEASDDSTFLNFLIIKTKLRKELLVNKVFTENQKFKLLRHFSKSL